MYAAKAQVIKVKGETWGEIVNLTWWVKRHIKEERVIWREDVITEFLIWSKEMFVDEEKKAS